MRALTLLVAVAVCVLGAVTLVYSISATAWLFVSIAKILVGAW